MILDKQPIKNLHINEAELKETVFLFEAPHTRTVTHVELKCEGRKRSIQHVIIHTYCPFCGTRYEAVSDKEVSHE